MKMYVLILLNVSVRYGDKGPGRYVHKYRYCFRELTWKIWSDKKKMPLSSDVT